MTRQTTMTAFEGGLDVSTSPLITSPGRAMACLNYEAVAEGYRRVDGIERFDGQQAPSTGRYWVLRFRSGTVPPSTGDVIEGALLGAAGILLSQPELVSGTWADGDAAGYAILVAVSGTFDVDEELQIGGSTFAVARADAMIDDSDDYVEYLTRLAPAQDYLRALVQKVPGSGPVRGVAIYKNAVYAWRDNSAATAAQMWKATPAGWAAVPLGRVLRFSEGLVRIEEGTRIYGAGGGEATAARIVQQSGDWGSDAAGYIVLSNVVGDFVDDETITASDTPSATVASSEVTTLPPGGRYQTIVHNFYGAKDRLRMYGVNGVGRAFEFDGAVFAPIETGMGADDKPFLLFEVAEHLGLVFNGGSVQLAVPGEPLLWDAVQGAFEFGFGAEVTNVVSSNDSAVALFGNTRIGILSGRDADTFQFDELTEEAGAAPWTAQRIGRTLYIDARGLRDLSATQAYGNFRTGSLLPEITQFFAARTKAGAKPIISFVHKGKSQYRVIWDDGIGLSVYMGRKVPEAMQFRIETQRLTCCAQGEMDSDEAIFAGAEDGYVYRIDSGPSLDGQAIDGFIMPPFNHLRLPTQDKRFHKVVLEIDGPTTTHLGLTAIFDYGESGKPFSLFEEVMVRSGGTLWNSGNYNQFYWSEVVRGKAYFDLDGIGVNVGLTFRSRSLPAEPAHVLQAYTIHWSPRRVLR